jgi:hypothetical protein
MRRILFTLIVFLFICLPSWAEFGQNKFGQKNFGFFHFGKMYFGETLDDLMASDGALKFNGDTIKFNGDTLTFNP